MQFWLSSKIRPPVTPSATPSYGKGSSQRLPTWNRYLAALSAHEVTGSAKDFGLSTHQAAWQKALARRASDPEAALTSARTLVEAPANTFSMNSDQTYDDAADLPML